MNDQENRSLTLLLVLIFISFAPLYLFFTFASFIFNNLFNWINYLWLFLFIISWVLIRLIKKDAKRIAGGGREVKVLRIEKLDYENISFLTSLVLPLLAISGWTNEGVFQSIGFILLVIIYSLKSSNIIFCPGLIICGFKVYKLDIQDQQYIYENQLAFGFAEVNSEDYVIEQDIIPFQLIFFDKKE